MKQYARLPLSALMALAVVLWATAAAAQAQTPSDNEEPPTPHVQLLPRTTFLLSAEHLADQDLAFVWDMNFGGLLDVIDYGAGRATFLANYQAILGDEFRHFDPNQGNYILSGTASLRTRGLEVAGVFYHQSRHLADRDNRVAVAWNMAGVRLERSLTTGRAHIDSRVDVRGVVARAFVDYQWEIEGAVRSDVQIRPTVAVLFNGSIRRLGVDDSQNRGDQTGFRGETGVRFEGRRGAMEFFLAAEQRIDPSPLQFGTARWASVGFRLLSR